MSGPKPGTPERMAMDAYPRQLTAQLHWLRGWQIGHGNAGALGASVGSRAEEKGWEAASVAIAQKKAGQ